MSWTRPQVLIFAYVHELQSRAFETLQRIQSRSLSQPDMARQDLQETSYLALNRPQRWESESSQSLVHLNPCSVFGYAESSWAQIAMTNEQKLRFFRFLILTGFKEIEVSYPAASDSDFGFCRELLNGGEVPDDVWIQV